MRALTEIFNRLGNKKEVWHDLIDQKKLPYLATIRNLRNMLMAGIDAAHVAKVCNYIKNEKAVAGSKMFPYRFFTAFDVLAEVKEFMAKDFEPVSFALTFSSNLRRQEM